MNKKKSLSWRDIGLGVAIFTAVFSTWYMLYYFPFHAPDKAIALFDSLKQIYTSFMSSFILPEIAAIGGLGISEKIGKKEEEVPEDKGE